jgi:hypothetical protein
MMPLRDSTQRTRWDPSAAPPVVWFVGPWGCAEFAVARPAIADAKFSDFSSPDAASAALAAGAPPPEVVLLAQPRPDCWPRSAVDALQAATPLARIVIVAGTWCEGEPRTGRPLVGAVRLYWHELPAWWRHSLARRERGFAPHWSQPRGTKSLDSSDAGDASAMLAGQTIAVDAVDFALFETLAATLRPYGAAVVWAPRGRGQREGASIGIFDGSQLDPAETTDLHRFCERFDRRPAPVIVLVDFPRNEHFDVLRELGACALLGKPYSIAALIGELVRTAAEQKAKDSPAPSPWRGGLGRGEEAVTKLANGSRVPTASPLPNPPHQGEGTGAIQY